MHTKGWGRGQCSMIITVLPLSCIFCVALLLCTVLRTDVPVRCSSPSKKSGEFVYLMYIQHVNPNPSHLFLLCHTLHLVLHPSSPPFKQPEASGPRSRPQPGC